MASEIKPQIMVPLLSDRLLSNRLDSSHLSFGTGSLCGLIALIPLQFLALTHPNLRETRGMLVLGSLLLELTTIFCAFSFNRVGVASKDDMDSLKKVWSLKYLWEVKTNMVLQSIIFLVQVRREIDLAITQNSTRDIYDTTEFTIFTPYVKMLLMGIAFCLYMGSAAHQKYAKLNSGEKPSLSHLLFSGFQFVFKVSCFASLVLPNLAHSSNGMQSLGFILLVLSSVLHPPTIFRYLFLTPSLLIFQSSDIRSELIDKTLQTCSGLGISIFIAQLFGMFKLVFGDSPMYPLDAFDKGSGLIYMRIAHIVLVYLMYSMASEKGRVQAGYHYLVTDVVFSMLNLLAVLFYCVALFIFRAPYFDTVSILLTFGIVFVAVKLVKYVKSVYEEWTIEEVKEDQLRALHYLNYYFTALLVGISFYLVSGRSLEYERRRIEFYTAYGMAMFWLISIATATTGLLYEVRAIAQDNEHYILET
jgi:hypothetical protein